MRDAKSKPKGKQVVRSSLLAVLGVLCVLAAAYFVTMVYNDRESDLKQLEQVREIETRLIDSHDLAKGVVEGRVNAVAELREYVGTIESSLQSLESGNNFSMDPVHPTAEAALNQVQANWRRISLHLNTVMTTAEELSHRNTQASRIADVSQEMAKSAQQVSVNLVKHGGSGAQIYYATKQLLSLETITQLAQSFGLRSTELNETAKSLSETLELYGQTLTAFLSGGQGARDLRVSHGETRQLLAQNLKQFESLQSAVDALTTKGSVYDRVNEALASIPPLVTEMSGNLKSLRNKIDAAVATRDINPQSAMMIGALGLFLLVVFVITSISSNNARAMEAVARQATVESANQQRQTEMRQLSDEIKPLIQGNLTVRADVNNSSTSSIARVFNNAIEQIEMLLVKLQDTSSAIGSAAEQSSRTSENLKVVKKRSEDVLENTSQMARKMSLSIENISQHAEETARSSDASARAVEVGRKSIDQTHQAVGVAETSIRVSSDMVKKLGEDIQQIRSIVLTIREITNNLQSLSYNTALIADRTSETERDAISATADKMENLTRTVNRSLEDIENIVTAITGRTAETQTHIEKSRTDFVDLVKNSNVTLESFRRIEDSTKESHENIRLITTETQALSNTSQRFIDNINDIEGLSREQSAATEETTQAVSKLNYLAEDLHKVARAFNTNNGNNDVA